MLSNLPKNAASFSVSMLEANLGLCQVFYADSASDRS